MGPGETWLVRVRDRVDGWSREAPARLGDFARVFEFEFNDAEDESGMDEKQALEVATILSKALGAGANILAHCSAGVCRSGAICEVGVAMGFEDLQGPRSPNLRAKRLLMKAAGFSNSWDPEPEPKPKCGSRHL